MATSLIYPLSGDWLIIALGHSVVGEHPVLNHPLYTCVKLRSVLQQFGRIRTDYNSTHTSICSVEIFVLACPRIEPRSLVYRASASTDSATELPLYHLGMQTVTMVTTQTNHIRTASLIECLTCQSQGDYKSGLTRRTPFRFIGSSATTSY